MARKKKHPEHENLERWLISYADFITLLFATFVVLYALSQVDLTDFKKLEDSIKQAFSAPSIMQGSDGLTKESSDSILEASNTDSVITPLMMEYMSQKYESQSFDEIENSVESMVESGELDGVEVEKTDRGLIIRFNDDYLFKSGSAVLSDAAKNKLDKVGAIIGKKFILHYMRVEGHTDNQAIVSSLYPSNWELSSARASSIIRYFIKRFKFTPSLFTAVGFADTRPLTNNNSPQGKTKNRRVEILILKNKFKGNETPQDDLTKLNKQQQEVLYSERMKTIAKIENMSDAARQLTKNNKNSEENMVILNQVYEKEVKRLEKETSSLDSASKFKITGEGSWLKPPAKGKNKADKSANNIKMQIKNEFDNEFERYD